FGAWRQADTERALRLAGLARDLLPLDDIATGPADELGLGAPWRAHSALDWTLQELRHHPGIGADLVLAGLSSPVTRNRHMSLAALETWPRDTWPEQASAMVAELARTDPDEKARARAASISD